MDQRGFPLEPADTPAAAASIPSTRMRAWADLATRRGSVELVPAQREHVAA